MHRAVESLTLQLTDWRERALTAERERDTACATVLELEKKLAESREGAKYAQSWREKWEHERSTTEALTIQKASALKLCEELKRSLALRTAERDDWERACHNREDDLREARHEAERYAAALVKMQDAAQTNLHRAERAERERDERRECKVLCAQLEADLAAAMKVVDVARPLRKWIVGDSYRAAFVDALNAFDARETSGGSGSAGVATRKDAAAASSEAAVVSPAQPEPAGDFTALVKALRETAAECVRRGSWDATSALVILANILERDDRR